MQAWGQEFDLQNPCEKVSVVLQAYNPSTGEGETDKLLASVASEPSLPDDFQISERSFFEK